MNQPNKPIIIVGAGLAGSILAVYLVKKGFPVEVYERRPDMRTVRMSAGKSINLALSARGIFALWDVDLFEEIAPMLIPMQGRLIHKDEGTVYSSYGRTENEYINSVSRAELNKRLMNLAESHPGVTFHFNHRCTGMNFDTGEVQFRNENTGDVIARTGETVIATDGATSAIRMEMLKIERFNFSQQYERHGYKELTIPPGPDGAFLLEKNALHIWPRKSYMLIALPNIDGTFTCTLFLPYEHQTPDQGEAIPGFDELTTVDAATAFFQIQFSDAFPLMPTFAEDFFSNPTGTLMTVTCDPWYIGDKAVLVGDASHAMVPFFGQGMNCAFEDCSVLSRCIDRHGRDWGKVFPEYFHLRKANTDAISHLAMENFIEMRDSVANDRFLFLKNVGLAIEERFPDRFIPKYSMVSFHRIPYAVVLERAQIQEDILHELCSTIETFDQLDWRRAEELITSSLPPIHDPED